MDTDKKIALPTDDPRIKRVLKRYLKGEEFSDASLELTGISFEELQSMCRCSADGFKVPRELDGYSLVNFTNRMGMSFDASKYDYFVHSYARREFCSPDRVPPKELHLPCEDGPPAKIPLAKGLHWVSTRPEDGKENYVGVEDEI
jgi:hypothetical protein